jgi:hypothetical protein
VLLGCLDVTRKPETEPARVVTTEQPRAATTPEEPAPQPKPEPEGTPAGPPPAKVERIDAAPKSIAFGDRQEIDSVVVWAKRAEIAQVLLRDPLSGKPGASTEKHLIVWLGIENESATKKVNYRTWAPELPFGNDAALLRDEFGNIYKRVMFGVGVEPLLRMRSASIYPGKGITDVLVFELPIEKATRLDLELPGENVGVDGIYRFRIDVRKLRTSGYKEPAEERAMKKPVAGKPKDPPRAAKPRGEDLPRKPKEPSPAERPLEERKKIYIAIQAALAGVETAAVKKFGRKPKADDSAGFAVQYRLFVERESANALDALTRDRGLLRFEVNEIKREGDDDGWPKK